MHPAGQPPPELHIASLVVHVMPARITTVAGQIGALPGAVLHGRSDNGKLVVTLEADSARTMSARVTELQQLDGVLSAALVYQCADSLDFMNEEMPDAQAGLL